jgi:hypothetical protein
MFDKCRSLRVFPLDTLERKKRKTNIGQSNVNLSPLALHCSRITLIQGGVDCLPYGGWALEDTLDWERQAELKVVFG